VSNERPVFNQINLVVCDMQAMVQFYEHLGVVFRTTLPEWERHHRTFSADNMLAGFDFDLDSQAFVTEWNAGWLQGRTGPVFGFGFPSAEAVDDAYRKLTEAGYVGQQSPWDGFMGARYAVVSDPDGNSVGLMSPIDPARSRMPPLPEERTHSLGIDTSAAEVDISFPVGAADDKELLLQWLGYLRQAVLRKVEGLTDEQARWTPSGKLIPLIGILNHLTLVEWRWIDGGFGGADVSRADEEFRPGDELTLTMAVDAYSKRAAKTDAVVRTKPLNEVGSGWAVGHDLRFVLLHLINETARHAGHADGTREMLDGSTGE
jgi:predicted enzyme related to lactoylglutathione lyase/uncharacterized damage-inducible protein DinB